MPGKKSIESEINEKTSDFRDTEIEYQFMAYLVCVNPSMASSVKADWFADVILQDVFSVVSELRITMSKAMVMSELKDRNIMDPKEKELFSSALDELFDVDTSTLNEKNAKHMAKQLLRLFESRRVLRACGKVIGSIRNFDLDTAKRVMAEASRTEVLDSGKTRGMYLDTYENRLDLMHAKQDAAGESEDGSAGIQTGIYHFDRITGGVMPSEFGVIGGVTGVGKTAALIEFGCNAYEAGHNVMIGSGEMSLEELAFRIDSRLTRIKGMKFRTAELTDDDYKTWDDTIKLYRAERDNVLYLASYPRTFTVEDFEQDKLRVEEETGQIVDMVCLDYINILTPVGRKKGGWEDQSDAVWDFKGFCKEYNLVGWTAGQVKDEAYDKELYDAQDLKYARAISEAAPIIVGLIQTDRDKIENRMKFQVIKMRNADQMPRPIRLTPNLGIMRLHEEMRRSKSLADLKGSHIDMERKARKSKPKRRR